MNAGRLSRNAVARLSQHLDGPARPVAGRKGALGCSKPVKFEGGSREASIQGESRRCARSARAGQLVVEVESAPAR